MRLGKAWSTQRLSNQPCPPPPLCSWCGALQAVIQSERRQRETDVVLTASYRQTRSVRSASPSGSAPTERRTGEPSPSRRLGAPRVMLCGGLESDDGGGARSADGRSLRRLVVADPPPSRAHFVQLHMHSASLSLHSETQHLHRALLRRFWISVLHTRALETPDSSRSSLVVAFSGACARTWSQSGHLVAWDNDGALGWLEGMERKTTGRMEAGLINVP